MGTLVAGWTAGKVLDKAQAVANDVLGTAAQNGSLVISKGARDAQLLIDAARQQLHDELGTQWEKLNEQEVSILREVDATTMKIERLGKKVENIQDSIVLDIDAELAKLPFSKSTPVIRRVDGGTQYFKKSGLYRVVLTSNLVGLAPPGSITATIGGKSLSKDAVNVKPPYEIAVIVPATMLTFDKTKLAYAPLVLHAAVSSERGLKFWKPSTRDADLTTMLELFPVRALTYKLIEWRSVPTVNSGRLEIQKGPDATVKGCGDSGCNEYHPQCVAVPSGGVPVDYINLRDSFAGWGGWGPSRVEGTQVCATYWQHSHNQTRNVGFDARYYPQELVRTAVPITLTKIDTATAPPPTNPGVAQNGTASNDIELGSTYNALFSNQYASYDLVVIPFTGESIVVTPGLPPKSSLVKVTKLEESGPFRRVTVQFDLPW